VGRLSEPTHHGRSSLELVRQPRGQEFEGCIEFAEFSAQLSHCQPLVRVGGVEKLSQSTHVPTRSLVPSPRRASLWCSPCVVRLPPGVCSEKNFSLRDSLRFRYRDMCGLVDNQA